MLSGIKRFHLLFLSFITLLFALPVKGQAQSVREYTTVDSLTVGDDFAYTITLNKDQPYDEIVFPDSSDFGSVFEIRSKQQFRVTSFRDSLIYRLQFFGTADTTIPPLPVTLISGNDSTITYTQPVPIYFKSILQEGDDSLRPLKPIFDFAVAWWPYILGFLIFAIAGWYLYRYYIQKSIEPEPAPKPEFQPEPFIDPIETLASSLNQLKSYSFDSHEDFKQFYINLGDTIRLYFERLYQIPALESTSREILMELDRRAIDEELIEQTRIVLNEADMVKFARFTPTEEQAQKALDKADGFLQRVRQVDRPQVEHMRRQHYSRMEARRQEFESQYQNEEEKV